MATEGRDELGRKSDGGLIFKQHADPAAELNDQARHHRPDKLDLDELNALTLGTRQAARLLWSGWNPWHPANLPATADLDHGVNFTTLTDEVLGSMGKIITKVYDGQEIKFCCKACIKKFEADKAKYLAKLK